MNILIFIVFCLRFWDVLLILNETQYLVAQSAGGVEYTDCFFAKG